MPMDPRETIRQLTLILDAALPLLDRAAANEFRRESGRALRQVTAQDRAKRARKLIEDVTAEFGIAL